MPFSYKANHLLMFMLYHIVYRDVGYACTIANMQYDAMTYMNVTIITGRANSSVELESVARMTFSR